MPQPSRVPWAAAAVLLALGLLLLLDPGLALLGYAMAVMGCALLLGQAVHERPLGTAASDLPARKNFRLRVAAIVATLLAVTAAFAYSTELASSSTCGPVGQLSLGSPSFPKSDVPGTFLAQVPLTEVPCPLPSTSELRITFDSAGSLNVSAQCGPGSGKADACPASEDGWYLMLVDSDGYVQDGYPSHAGGDLWIGGSAALTSGESFELVGPTNFASSGGAFSVRENLTTCILPWCVGTSENV